LATAGLCACTLECVPSGFKGHFDTDSHAVDHITTDQVVSLHNGIRPRGRPRHSGHNLSGFLARSFVTANLEFRAWTTVSILWVLKEGIILLNCYQSFSLQSVVLIHQIRISSTSSLQTVH